jgi:proteasome lid subunit RPN8/RPN11
MNAEWIKDEILDAIRAHAAESSPRECCGVVIVERGRVRYVPCRNRAAKAEHFLLSEDDYADAEDRGHVMAVVHSHPYLPPTPSQADMVGCEKSGLPWLIVNHPLGHWHYFEPTGYVAPLIGREFVHGVLDCYSLCRDYYATIGLNLSDYERDMDWWLNGGDLYRKYFAAEGFVEVFDEPRQHDAFLMQLGSPVPNHAAVYIGDGLILHHVMHRLSSRDVYGGMWRRATCTHLRHRTLC